MWEHPSDSASHSDSLCLVFWHSTDGKHGGGGSEAHCHGTQGTPEFRTSSNCGFGVGEVLTFTDVFIHKRIFLSACMWLFIFPVNNPKTQLKYTSQKIQIKAIYICKHLYTLKQWDTHTLAFACPGMHTETQVHIHKHFHWSRNWAKSFDICTAELRRINYTNWFEVTFKLKISSKGYFPQEFSNACILFRAKDNIVPRMSLSEYIQGCRAVIN